MQSLTPLAAVVLLFLAVGVGFIFVHLLAGKLIRPNKPDAEKKTVYECGEPTVGSAWIQFDLRFYVVALLFVIFDVEVAFFFPWAVVFGQAVAVSAVGPPTDAAAYHELAERAQQLVPGHDEFDVAKLDRLRAVTDDDVARLHELAVKVVRRQRGEPVTLTPQEMGEYSRLSALESSALEIETQCRSFSRLALVEILLFFGVLLVGFAYLWRRGDLEWVRSTLAERPIAPPRPPPPDTNGAGLIGAPASGALVEAGS